MLVICIVSFVHSSHTDSNFNSTNLWIAFNISSVHFIDKVYVCICHRVLGGKKITKKWILPTDTKGLSQLMIE